MLLLLILTISGLSYLAMGGYEANLIKNRMDSSQAFYAAEAGIQQARWISKFWDWGNCKPGVPWPGSSGSDGEGDYYGWEGALEDGMGDYTVKIRKAESADPNKVDIVSIGSLGFFERKVEVDNVPTAPPPPPPPPLGSNPGRGGDWQEPEF